MKKFILFSVSAALFTPFMTFAGAMEQTNANMSYTMPVEVVNVMVSDRIYPTPYGTMSEVSPDLAILLERAEEARESRGTEAVVTQNVTGVYTGRTLESGSRFSSAILRPSDFETYADYREAVQMQRRLRIVRLTRIVESSDRSIIE